MNNMNNNNNVCMNNVLCVYMCVQYNMIQYVKIMIHVLYTHKKQVSPGLVCYECRCVLYAYYTSIAQVLQGYHTQILSTYCCPALYIYMCVCVCVCVCVCGY